ncbi:MAG: class I SAM-dependent methyltransferase [Burkholderiales bacterium]|nr:class I SAM-dependent methyltransferase [Burkholderiales bacterium]
MDCANNFLWAERMSPELLKSPWWIGHIPFAFEIIGRLKPTSVVELGTYSGSSFAAFCQAVQENGIDAKCYGIDLWEGDVHMGRFDDSLYQEIAAYVGSRFPDIGVLVRKDFNEAAKDFSAGSVDLLHIDGTHTYEAVSNDFHTWLPKMSDRGVILFHDINVTVENAGPAALKFGVRKFFDEVRGAYPSIEFSHCYGLGVLLVGRQVPESVRELVGFSTDPAFAEYFARKGAAVSNRFEDMSIPLPVHSPYGADAGLLRRAMNKVHRIIRRLGGAARPT